MDCSIRQSLLSRGFRDWQVADVLKPGLACVTQIHNEDDLPVMGHQDRFDGSRAWAVFVAPSLELAEAACDGSLFGFHFRDV